MGVDCSLFLKKDGVFNEHCYLDRWYIFSDDFESAVEVPRQVMINKLNKLKKKIEDNQLDPVYNKEKHLVWVRKAIDELSSNCDIESVLLAADYDIEYDDIETRIRLMKLRKKKT